MEFGEAVTVSHRKTGRPLSFDRAIALEQAMLTFWRHGYETTSIADLTTAMGITPPSLYTAFGDKKRLFLEAVQLYAGDPEAMAQTIADAPSAYDAARDMLIGAATAFTDEATPPGCLLASATASGSAASADVQRAVADIRQAIAARLRGRIARDIG
jgi:AcrR family transcriptional regulator